MAVVATLTTALASPPLAFGTTRAVGAFQPDARIKLRNGPYVGDGVINTTGAGQKRSATVSRNSGTHFTIAIKNVGPESDSFFVHAIGEDVTRSAVYYFEGTREITTEVVAGTYQTPSVAPGASVRVKITAVIGRQSPDHLTVTRLVRVTSAVSTAEDAVKLTVRLR